MGKGALVTRAERNPAARLAVALVCTWAREKRVTRSRAEKCLTTSPGPRVTVRVSNCTRSPGALASYPRGFLWA